MSIDNTSSSDLARYLVAQVAFARYAAALDEHDLTALETLHDEDAAWTFSAPGQPALGRIEGRHAILDFVAHAAHAPEQTQRHVVTNISVVGGRGNVIEATGYLLLTSNASGVTVITATGTIRARLIQAVDQWKISSLAIHFDSAPPA
jgi:3-phenylpropionate/cinnamic acid dioxygenase small subunit